MSFLLVLTSFSTVNFFDLVKLSYFNRLSFNYFKVQHFCYFVLSRCSVFSFLLIDNSIHVYHVCLLALRQPLKDCIPEGKKKSPSPSRTSITNSSSAEGGSSSLLHAVVLYDLIFYRSCTCNHDCCHFICTTAVLYPGRSLQSFIASGFYNLSSSFQVPEPWEEVCDTDAQTFLEQFSVYCKVEDVEIFFLYATKPP